MKFSKLYNLSTGLTKGIRTHWSTDFVIDDDKINGYRVLNGTIYCLSIPLDIGETFSAVLSKIDRLVMIENNMFRELSIISHRNLS